MTDKAEVFGWLMTEDEHLQLQGLEDEIVTKKVAYMVSQFAKWDMNLAWFKSRALSWRPSVFPFLLRRYAAVILDVIKAVILGVILGVIIGIAGLFLI